jgi:hypothetical protein
MPEPSGSRLVAPCPTQAIGFLFQLRVLADSNFIVHHVVVTILGPVNEDQDSNENLFLIFSLLTKAEITVTEVPGQWKGTTISNGVSVLHNLRPR